MWRRSMAKEAATVSLQWEDLGDTVQDGSKLKEVLRALHSWQEMTGHN